MYIYVYISGHENNTISMFVCLFVCFCPSSHKSEEREREKKRDRWGKSKTQRQTLPRMGRGGPEGSSVVEIRVRVTPASPCLDHGQEKHCDEKSTASSSSGLPHKQLSRYWSFPTHPSLISLTQS
jgi:hypothetical protein